MSIANFEPGQKIFINENLYEIARLISEDEWQIECQRTGRYEIKTTSDLLELYSQNKIRFLSQDDGKAVHRRKQFNNLDDIPANLRDEAIFRRSYVTGIESAGIQYLTEKSMTPIIESVHQKIKTPPKPPHWSTVHRWYKRYRIGGRDIRALITDSRSKGNRTRRYGGDLLEIVRKAIASTYLKREQPTIEDTYQAAIDLVRLENKLRPENYHLPKPTYSLVRTEIYSIPVYDRDLARLGKHATMVKYRRVKGANEAKKPLERAEIDHTTLDIMVVDDDVMLPLGRPTLTVCQDVKSRCILGVYIGFEPPSFSTVAHCLKQSIMPKNAICNQFPSLQHDWECYGVMANLVVDNGLEFHSANLEALCFPFGINIQYSPRKQPWFKPHIERVISSINQGVAHGNPGTTFANIFDKQDYDAAKNATIRLTTLKEIIYTWIVDIHHQRIHKSLMQQPSKVWRELVDPTDVPLPATPQDLDYLTGSINTRKITHKGIELYGLLYNSKQLEELRKLLGSEIKVSIRYNEANLGYVYVAHPETNEVIQVPSLKPSYTEGLSLWQHKVCKKFARQHLERKDIEGIAQAKAHIRKLIEQDFDKKKVKTRAKAARFTAPEAIEQKASLQEIKNPETSVPVEQRKQSKYERISLPVDFSDRPKWNQTTVKNRNSNE
jgi:putative transposase